MNRCKTAGFTLMELLVSLAILSVVTTIGTAILVKVTDAHRQTELRLNLEDRAEFALGQIRDDCGRVVSSTYANAALIGEKLGIEEEAGTGVMKMESRLVLPVAPLDAASGGPEPASVMYHLVREGKELPRLMRTVGKLGSIPEGASQEVAKGVTMLWVEYQDGGGNWVDEWSGPGMPKALRVNLVLADELRPYEQIARRAAFLIQVN